MSDIKLYSYYRSTAAYRVRIALNIKNLDYDIIPVNLLTHQQRSDNFKKLNPQMRVPLLIDGNFQLGQSLAILEYLEEQYPSPALLPKDPQQRAQTRRIANIIACEMHPLNNLGVLNYLKSELAQAETAVTNWYHHWLREGYNAIEQLLTEHDYSGNQYFCGDEPSYADLCLIPQNYNARRFNFDMSPYPRCLALDNFCLQQVAFHRARPESQPDAPSL